MMELNENTERFYAFWLCSLPGIYPHHIQVLLKKFGTCKEIFYAERKTLEHAIQRKAPEPDGNFKGSLLAEKILENKNIKTIQNDYEAMTKKGIHFVYREEADFPEKLKNIPDAPFGLFYKGKLPSATLPSVAVVGARKATGAGKQIAEKLGYELAANGVQVISGLAYGIDICSQKGAVNWKTGHTFSVFGTGVDICYPRSHIEMYMKIQENGGLISEYPLGTPPLPAHFPIRNRIISGLSDGVLIVEARKKSGSLITAECALEQGREIFVVPGMMCDPQYEGGNELLKSGAVLVTDVKDILDGLGIYLDMDMVERKKKTNILLETTEKMVYASLSLEPIHISELSAELDIGPGKLMETLFSLQKKGVAKMVGNNYFILKI